MIKNSNEIKVAIQLTEVTGDDSANIVVDVEMSTLLPGSLNPAVLPTSAERAETILNSAVDAFKLQLRDYFEKQLSKTHKAIEQEELKAELIEDDIPQIEQGEKEEIDNEHIELEEVNDDEEENINEQTPEKKDGGKSDSGKNKNTK